MYRIDGKQLEAKLDTTFEQDIKSGRVGGIAAAVAQDGKVIYRKCFSNPAIGIDVTDRTLFRLASMTKPINAIGVLMLVERGEIGLDDPVYKYVPAFEKMKIGKIVQNELQIIGEAKQPITIRHLLSHCSGLGSGPVGNFSAAMFPGPERRTLTQAVNYYGQVPLDFEPHTRQAYSGVFAFDVLARIVEIVSGLSFERFLQKNVFAPLDMTDTVFSPSEDQWARMIPMHTYEDGAGKTVDFPADSIFEGIPTSCFCGGAGLASTLDDYMKFGDMLLNGGKCGASQIISERMVREMATPQLPREIMGGPEIWGLGVRVIVDHPANVLPIGCFGWSGAYGGHFWIDPANRIVAVYLKNSRFDGGSGALTARVFERNVYCVL